MIDLRRLVAWFVQLDWSRTPAALLIGTTLSLALFGLFWFLRSVAGLRHVQPALFSRSDKLLAAASALLGVSLLVSAASSGLAVLLAACWLLAFALFGAGVVWKLVADRERERKRAIRQGERKRAVKHSERQPAGSNPAARERRRAERLGKKLSR